MSSPLASLKTFVKPLLPRQVLDIWRRRKYEAEQSFYKDMPLEKVFEHIYEENVWHRDGSTARYRSGPGSQADVTAPYEAFVVGYILRHPDVRKLVDIGCGDFQVSRRILDALAAKGRLIDYVGCDIAANVVAYNREQHGRDGIDFEVLDVSRQQPPSGDLVTVREVFQHLSNAHVAQSLANLAGRFDRAIITESIVPNSSNPNIDIVSGYRTRDGYDSGIFIDLAPFSLKVIEEHVTEQPPRQCLRTTVVALRPSQRNN